MSRDRGAAVDRTAEDAAEGPLMRPPGSAGPWKDRRAGGFPPRTEAFSRRERLVLVITTSSEQPSQAQRPQRTHDRSVPRGLKGPRSGAFGIGFRRRYPPYQNLPEKMRGCFYGLGAERWRDFDYPWRWPSATNQRQFSPCGFHPAHFALSQALLRADV